MGKCTRGKEEKSNTGMEKWKRGKVNAEKGTAGKWKRENTRHDNGKVGKSRGNGKVWKWNSENVLTRFSTCSTFPCVMFIHTPELIAAATVVRYASSAQLTLAFLAHSPNLQVAVP